MRIRNHMAQLGVALATWCLYLQPTLSDNLKRNRNTIRYLYDEPETSLHVEEYKFASEVENNNLLTSSSLSSSNLLFDSNADFAYRPAPDLSEYRIIQFYDSSLSRCSDCEYFKEHYVKLAVRLQEIVQSKTHDKNEVKLAVHAVSCAHYPKLCQTNEVDTNRLPIIRLYPAGKDPIGFDIHYQSIHPFNVIERLGVRAKLEQLSAVSTKAPDSSGLNLELEEHWSVGNMIEHKRQVETKSKKNGLFQRFWSNKRKPPGEGITNRALKNLSKPYELENDVNRVLDNLLRNYIHQSLNNGEGNGNGEVDLKSSIQYYPVSEDSQRVLKEFFLLLRKTLPQTWKVHNLLNELTQNLIYVANNRNYLIEMLDELKDEGRFPGGNNKKNNEWSIYCTDYITRNPVDSERGEFTCGFWELLHTIAVGLVEYNQFAFDGSEKIPVSSVLEVIRNLLQSFNGGGLDMISRTSLFYMLDTCAHDACNRLAFIPGGGEKSDWVQLPLWLNEMQNYLDIQMLKRYAYRAKRSPRFQEEIDVQRPSVADCPRCWEEKVPGDFVLSNHEMIFKYLKIYYGPQNDSVLLNNLRQQVLSNMRNKKGPFHAKEHHAFEIVHSWGVVAPTAQLRNISLVFLAIIILAFLGNLIFPQENYHNKKKARRMTVVQMEIFSHVKAQ